MEARAIAEPWMSLLNVTLREFGRCAGTSDDVRLTPRRARLLLEYARSYFVLRSRMRLAECIARTAHSGLEDGRTTRWTTKPGPGLLGGCAGTVAGRRSGSLVGQRQTNSKVADVFPLSMA